jgi:hypothetical protein
VENDDTGWISGSCGSTPNTPMAAHINPGVLAGAGMERADPNGVDRPAADAWSAGTQRWITGGHEPARPSWECRSCGQRWPCPAAQHSLARCLAGRALAVVMAQWMQQAAGDLGGDYAPGALFDRFLLWTRRL